MAGRSVVGDTRLEALAANLQVVALDRLAAT